MHTGLRRWGALAAVVLAWCVGGPGCRQPVDARVLRLGYFPNVTHAPALAGVESGRFARALGATRLETRVFNAGPAAMEALLSGALDAAYVGPSPVLNAWVASRGRGVRVVAGAASGGALFVVRPAANIHRPEDLRGRRLATPQLGNTQDVALRRYLNDHGLNTTDRGGAVTVTPLENPEILTRFRLGQLDGAWVPEPWGSRLVAEAGATVFVDERDLWPGRAFATTLLVVRQDYARAAPDNIQRLLRAHVAEIEFLRRDPVAGRAVVHRALARVLGRPLPAPLLESAWARVDFTTDPLEDTLRRNARSAAALGFLRSDDIHGLVDTAPLRSAGAVVAEGR
jgi:NitT/TauT family transport system substrate-binding protein